jgi:hypothetical protein
MPRKNPISYETKSTTETVTVRMRRKEFSGFLHELHGFPLNFEWKEPTMVIANPEELAGSVYYYIELFADTPLGLIVAKHEEVSEDVHVMVPRPGAGIYNTAQSLLDELRKSDNDEGKEAA